MSERVAKLQALLARVTARAAEPRVRHAVAAAPAAAPVDDDFESELPTRPPPAGVAAPPEIEVELPEPAIELQTEAPAQSDERIVAAKPVAQEPEPEEIPAVAAAPELEVAGDLMGEEAEELPEPEAAPSSSRRPLGPPAGEVLEAKAFGGEPEPAIHTPPPESGKLPAAPEIPPAVEAADYDNQDITGVHHTPATREPAPAVDVLAQSGEHAAKPVAHAEPPREPSKLMPEITHAAPKASAPVHDVIGEANAFKPATFAELLEASLKL